MGLVAWLLFFLEDLSPKKRGVHLAGAKFLSILPSASFVIITAFSYKGLVVVCTNWVGWMDALSGYIRMGWVIRWMMIFVG
ncbi:hypothetical protein B0T20DRAFT_120421 [Sordaria brevicollis]|uniref:Uncharacterized protein n=1 Tax=Sordaria brevicollis TaxID=83679 RepID=A0AAE0UF01_SORBR|nr:hypothetical protein B0T20DRAFT_120421 [Sordaria brevicollis]